MTSLCCRAITVLVRVLLVGVGLTALGCAADGTATASGNASDEESIVVAAESDSADRGSDLAETNCIQCHGPGFLPTFKRSKSEWLLTIDRMLAQYGEMMDGGASAAKITPEERDILADYLAGN